MEELPKRIRVEYCRESFSFIEKKTKKKEAPFLLGS